MKKKVGVNVYAKINFTLNVGKKNGEFARNRFSGFLDKRL